MSITELGLFTATIALHLHCQNRKKCEKDSNDDHCENRVHCRGPQQMRIHDQRYECDKRVDDDLTDDESDEGHSKNRIDLSSLQKRTLGEKEFLHDQEDLGLQRSHHLDNMVRNWDHFDDYVEEETDCDVIWTESERARRKKGRKAVKRRLTMESFAHNFIEDRSERSLNMNSVRSFDEEKKYQGDEDDLCRKEARSSESCGSSSVERYVCMKSSRNFQRKEHMPKKIILVRHGESEGNVNDKIYATKPDNALILTDLGWEQAKISGEALKQNVIGAGESVHFIVSPYARTMETFHGILSAWCNPDDFAHIKCREERMIAWYTQLFRLGLTWHEDPRIREQDFGNYQDHEIIRKAKSERHKFGQFFYRFPNGESASDVSDRVSTFLDSLWRSFDSKGAQNVVLVTHGVACRVFLHRFFHYTIDQFNMLANPTNCEMCILKHDGVGNINLDGRYEVNVRKTVDENGEERKQASGFTRYSKLRILPQHLSETRTYRISQNDTLD